MTCDEVVNEIEKRTGKKPVIKCIDTGFLIGVQPHYGTHTVFSSLPITLETRSSFVEYMVGLSGGISDDPQLLSKKGE
jgi:hypothetical protein